jgi:hypothetical protein
VFAAPERIGGYLLDGTGPAVATDAGQPVVAVLGGNRALYTIAHGATTFTGLGGAGLGVTAITVNNRSLFIVRGTNGAAYSHGNVPGNWFKIGGVMISAPLSATSSTGMPTLFVVGGNGRTDVQPVGDRLLRTGRVLSIDQTASFGRSSRVLRLFCVI